MDRWLGAALDYVPTWLDVRDGVDNGFYTGRRPFPDSAQLLADLAQPPIIKAGLRMKYSNHGYGLLGQVIANAAKEPYLQVTGRDSARVAAANGYASHGETVRRVRTRNGRIREIWVGADRMVSKAVAVAELERRCGGGAGKSRRAVRRK